MNQRLRLVYRWYTFIQIAVLFAFSPCQAASVYRIDSLKLAKLVDSNRDRDSNNSSFLSDLAASYANLMLRLGWERSQSTIPTPPAEDAIAPTL
jgi:hypothetical protein